MFTKEDVTAAWEILSAYAKDLKDGVSVARDHNLVVSLLKEHCSEELATLAIKGLSYLE